MNEELLKNLLRLKISLAHKVSEALPERMQRSVNDLEAHLMHALYEVTKEYVDKGPNSEETRKGSLKTIDVL